MQESNSIYKNRKIIDTHAHMCDDSLVKMLPQIVSELSANGVSAVVEVGSNIQSSRQSVQVANSYKCVYSTVGIHPQDALTLNATTLAQIEQLAKTCNKVCAIGEIGLDYHYQNFDKVKQIEAAKQQIELSHALNLPIVFHMRDSGDDALRLIKDMKGHIKCGVLFHCYSASTEYQRQLLKVNEDTYFSFGGVITFKNADEKRNVALNTPQDRLLIETDCPYMAPTPHRGKLNQPMYVNYVLDELNNIFGKDMESATTENALRFFKKIVI